jgi:hypothetical protein
MRGPSGAVVLGCIINRGRWCRSVWHGGVGLVASGWAIWTVERIREGLGSTLLEKGGLLPV